VQRRVAQFEGLYKPDTPSNSQTLASNLVEHGDDDDDSSFVSLRALLRSLSRDPSRKAALKKLMNDYAGSESSSIPSLNKLSQKTKISKGFMRNEEQAKKLITEDSPDVESIESNSSGETADIAREGSFQLGSLSFNLGNAIPFSLSSLSDMSLNPFDGDKSANRKNDAPDETRRHPQSTSPTVGTARSPQHGLPPRHRGTRTGTQSILKSSSKGSQGRPFGSNGATEDFDCDARGVHNKDNSKNPDINNDISCEEFIIGEAADFFDTLEKGVEQSYNPKQEQPKKLKTKKNRWGVGRS
jgi:hypothetical protein